jgi:hypothetical protein
LLPNKLAVAEHSIDEGHHMNSEDTILLARMAGCVDHLVKEAIEIWLHPDNFNRHTGFTVSQSWKLATNILCKYSAIKQQQMEGSMTASSPDCPG